MRHFGPVFTISRDQLPNSVVLLLQPSAAIAQLLGDGDGSGTTLRVEYVVVVVHKEVALAQHHSWFATAWQTKQIENLSIIVAALVLLLLLLLIDIIVEL